MSFFNMLIGITGGMCLAAQGGVNSALSAVWTKDAILAAFVSFTIGALVLFACVILLRIPIPSLSKGATKWWHWVAGLFGSYFVFSATYLAPIVGAGLLVALVLIGQLGSAVILDHYGLMGFPKKKINLNRILGIGLLGVGVVLIRFF